MSYARIQNYGDATPTNGELIGTVITTAIAIIAMAIFLITMDRASGRSKQDIHPDTWAHIAPQHLPR
jgi:hypothetical protein